MDFATKQKTGVSRKVGLELGDIVVDHTQRETEAIQVFDVIDCGKQPRSHAEDEQNTPGYKTLGLAQAIASEYLVMSMHYAK